MTEDMLTMLLSAIVTVTLILTVAGVVLLRPLSHRLGALLEAMARERNQLQGKDDNRLRELLDAVEARVSLLEERQDFAEALQRDRGDPKRLAGGPDPSADE